MLIILPVRNMVLFPQLVLPLSVKRERSVAAAQEAVKSGRKVGLLLQKEADENEPGIDGLQRIGTMASIVRYVTAPDGTHHLICHGEQRFRVLDFVSTEPFPVARIELLTEPALTDPQIEARALRLRELANEALALLPQAPAELGAAIANIEPTSALADLIASFLDIKPAEAQVLEASDLRVRLDLVLTALQKRLEVLRISHALDERAKGAFDERQKEAVLRERLHQIRKELGEDGNGSAEIAELKETLANAGMPKEIRGARAQSDRAAGAHGENSAEYSMTRGYLEWALALPWAKLDQETSISRRRGRSWMRTTLALRPSNAASSSLWRCASSIPRVTAQSCASSDHLVSARLRWVNRLPGRWG